MKIYQVKNRNKALVDNLVTIWEDSVKATHSFLTLSEIEKIKQYVPIALLKVQNLIIAEDNNTTIGFIGTEQERIEMLFISPNNRKKGIGKALINYAITNYHINEVTVNEQNIEATHFYEHMGFEIYKKTELDEQGNPYPLLYMKLALKKLKFILPTKENKDDVLSFYDEFAKTNTVCIGYNNYHNFDIWLKEMENRLKGKKLPKGYVRENFYLCYDEKELIGVFSLKFQLTDFLLNYGGHIGYAVRPTKQNKGYGTKILNQGIEIAKNFGFEKILCICDEDNIASEKVIIRNGGIFENKLYDKDDAVFVKRYWIKLLK